MAKTFRKAPRQNLLRIPVLIEDAKFYSEYFEVSELDRIFHAGKNGFLIRGSQFLRQGSEISIEVLDRYNSPIFSTPVANYSEAGSRLVSVEIFQKTNDGPGKLVIVGSAETYADGRPVPDEYRGRPNVRWTVPIQIETANPNTSPLRLANRPIVDITEKAYLTSRINTTEATSSVYTASLTYDAQGHLSDGYAISMTTGSGGTAQAGSGNEGLTIVGSFFDTVNLDGMFTGSLWRRIIEVDPHTDKTAAYTTLISTGDDQGYVTASVSMSLNKVLNESTAITQTPIKFGDGSDYLNPILPGFPNEVQSGSFVRVLDTTGTKQRLEEYTSSVVFRYISEALTTTTDTSSVLNIRVPFAQTNTGEIAKVRVLTKQ